MSASSKFEVLSIFLRLKCFRSRSHRSDSVIKELWFLLSIIHSFGNKTRSIKCDITNGVAWNLSRGEGGVEDLTLTTFYNFHVPPLPATSPPPDLSSYLLWTICLLWCLLDSLTWLIFSPFQKKIRRLICLHVFFVHVF